MRVLTCESVDDTRTATVRTAACERHPARSRPRVVGGDDEGLVAVSSHELTLTERSLLWRPDAVDVLARRVVGDVRRFPRFVDARFALHHRLGRLHTTLLRTCTCTLGHVKCMKNICTCMYDQYSIHVCDYRLCVVETSKTQIQIW